MIILTADIGASKSGFALVRWRPDGISLLRQRTLDSRGVTDCVEPLSSMLHEAQTAEPSIDVTACCISAAGVVQDNQCSLTNLPWKIDGGEIGTRLGIRTWVLNDLVATAYGVLALQTRGSAEIQCIFSGSREKPPAGPRVSLVFGIGTAFGVSYVVGQQGNEVVLPSEGGHAAFADFDRNTRALKAFVSERTGNLDPDVGSFVSGRGVLNLFEYVRQNRSDDLSDEIARAAERKRAKQIFGAGRNSSVCRDVVELYLNVLARITIDLETLFLPTGGVFFCGGVVARNPDLFLDEQRFVKYLRSSGRPEVRRLIHRFPVYAVPNHNIPHFGAASFTVLQVQPCRPSLRL